MNANTDTLPTGGKNRNLATDDLSDEAHVTAHVVKPLVGNPSSPTLWRWINNGDFPKPERRTGPAQSGSRLWRLGTIRQYLRGDWKPEATAA